MTGPAVVVVGGGLVGCCVAYRLAQRGVKVTVVERGHPGCEASSAAGGILVPEARADVPPALLRFWLDGLRYYPEFVAEVHDASGVAFEARFPGRLVVAVSDDEAREMADF
jgi:glycine oxidase